MNSFSGKLRGKLAQRLFAEAHFNLEIKRADYWNIMDIHSEPSVSLVADTEDMTIPGSALDWLSELVAATEDGAQRTAWAIQNAQHLGLTQAHCEQPAEQAVAALFRHGPAHSGGIVVTFDLASVPIPRNDWTSRPEEMTIRGAHLVGRGVTGAGALLAASFDLISSGWRPDMHPLWLALFDSRLCTPTALKETLDKSGLRPRMVLSAQATGLVPVNAHPGYGSYRTHVYGSCGQTLPSWAGINAAETAVRYAGQLSELRSALMLRAGQATLAVEGIRSEPGQGAMPHRASLDWVISYWKSSDQGFVLDALDQFSKDSLEPQMQAMDATSGIALERMADLPPLRAASHSDEALKAVFKRPAQAMQVSGWGGAWQTLGAPVASFGPGDPGAAYRPNEAIHRRDLAACRALMQRIARVLD